MESRAFGCVYREPAQTRDLGGIMSPCPFKRWTHLANNPGPCCYCKNARLVAFVLELLGFQGIKTIANRVFLWPKVMWSRRQLRQCCRSPGLFGGEDPPTEEDSRLASPSGTESLWLDPEISDSELGLASCPSSAPGKRFSVMNGHGIPGQYTYMDYSLAPYPSTEPESKRA
ncbi:unnamed protein product [Caretta caretta]